ncbi:OmpA family protein [Dechloromonas sp. ZY10]|uniref:OmpA family protein n=1 Tax=Dechloromonas aquae TaxID=2664436 RepID=UPI003526D6C9
MHFSSFFTVDRKQFGRGLLAGLLALALSACGGKSYVVLLENPDGSTGQILVKGAKGEQSVSVAGQGVPNDGSAPPAAIPREQIERDFGAALAAQPKLPVRFLLYFQSAGVALTGESQALLPKILDEVGQRPAPDVSVIGHTDTVGKAEMNEALALKRAEAIATLLKDKGLKVHALSVESHGERNLLVATPDETAEPRNRRVEISVR